MISVLLFCSCGSSTDKPTIDPSPNVGNVTLKPFENNIEKQDTVIDFKEDSSLVNEPIKDSLEEVLAILPTPKIKLLLFDDNGRFGYKNKSGEIVLAATYQMANDFVNGMAEVVDDQGWAYINGNGEVIARPFIYDNGPDYFREGLARYVEEDKIGFLNEKGIKVISSDFDFAKPFDNGLSLVCLECRPKSITHESGEHWTTVGGKWGIINTKGEWVLPCKYTEVKDFGKGVVGYKEGEKWIKKTIEN